MSRAIAINPDARTPHRPGPQSQRVMMESSKEWFTACYLPQLALLFDTNMNYSIRPSTGGYGPPRDGCVHSYAWFFPDTVGLVSLLALGAVPRTGPAVVLAEGHITNPVQPVLDLPLAAGQRGQPDGVLLQMTSWSALAAPWVGCAATRAWAPAALGWGRLVKEGTRCRSSQSRSG